MYSAADPPVEALRQVGVDRLAGDVLHLAHRLDRHGEVVVAEHVAEVQRGRAAHVGAEAVDADADRRLADGRELSFDLYGPACSARLAAAGSPVFGSSSTFSTLLSTRL